ncbi:hypothetical protein SYNTR_1444 [Candidatus Syntrophocurvum alkaliphilum]|uniref:DUF2344 domain-containing protein n=1 Tax=Candidatus Syntrophocurvum alkaliphilum TaxID=2293317 RepID=A0A6I6DG89_9FIRM|nr:TIGR03936 family radical SAM-associated protein [Candidatus Syntrophocurvum alkaliphilum]QGU00038.1 hypothetical protein SYNTR_1444 [Candidatus Syntrophocurvum alkaliphilum]
MRLRVEYKVGPELRFLGNLDMINLMKRALRRADIPYALGGGYNPNVKLSMGTVLPVGVWGEREYFDLELKEYLQPNEFISKMNNTLPDNLKINQCMEINAKAPSLMKIINSACYSIVVNDTKKNLEQIVSQIINSKEIKVQGKGKKKNVIKDIRPGIYSINMLQTKDSVIINIWVSTGDEINVRYDELETVIIDFGLNKDNIVDLFRYGNFVKEGNYFYNPLEKVK